MQNNRKHRPGRILRIAYPIAKYAAVLLIPLNLYRLPRQTWLLPGISGILKTVKGTSGSRNGKT